MKQIKRLFLLRNNNRLNQNKKITKIIVEKRK